MGIQYKRGALIDIDPTLYDAELNNDGLIIQCSKTDNSAPLVVANKFALSCLVQGDGVSYMNTGTVAVPVWNIVSTDGSFTTSGVISSAQLLNITTPITILPASNLGEGYQVISWKFRYVPGTVAYTIPPGPGFSVRLLSGVSNTIWASLQALSSIITTLTSSTIVSTVGGIVGFTIQDNTNLNLAGLSSNPTNGDGTLEYEIKYKVITL